MFSHLIALDKARPPALPDLISRLVSRRQAIQDFGRAKQATAPLAHQIGPQVAIVQRSDRSVRTCQSAGPLRCVCPNGVGKGLHVQSGCPDVFVPRGSLRLCLLARTPARFREVSATPPARQRRPPSPPFETSRRGPCSRRRAQLGTGPLTLSSSGIRQCQRNAICWRHSACLPRGARKQPGCG